MMNRSARSLMFSLVAIVSNMHAAEEAPVKPYPLSDCVISEETLGSLGKPLVLVYEGQEFKFCCKDCKKTFERNPAKAIAKFEAAVKAQASSAKK